MFYTLFLLIIGIALGWKLKENNADSYLMAQRDSAIRAASNAQARFQDASSRNDH